MSAAMQVTRLQPRAHATGPDDTFLLLPAGAFRVQEIRFSPALPAS